MAMTVTYINRPGLFQHKTFEGLASTKLILAESCRMQFIIRRLCIS